VFISHAGEQKRGFVDFLLDKFNELHPALKVFVDEYTLDKGGDALPAINAALGDAFVGKLTVSWSYGLVCVLQSSSILARIYIWSTKGRDKEDGAPLWSQ
jgi:hypothetical protein